MDAWTSLAEGEQFGVWLITSLCFLLLSLVVFPCSYAYKRHKFRRQISSHLVTSTYKLPEELTPAELSYLFSPTIGKRQVYGSLMQLVNEGILQTSIEMGRLLFNIGPRVDSKMSLSSAYIVDTLENNDYSHLTHDFIIGNMSYRIPNTQEKVEGSKLYVFWWLVREGLRQRNVIVGQPIKSYITVVLVTLLKIALLSIIITVVLHGLLMMAQGEISFSATSMMFVNALEWLVISFPATFIVTFILVRIRGKFLGRHWILTERKQRLLNQFDAYREYVRLIQEGSVAFENDQAQRNAELRTLPYAVALGYAKPPEYYAKPD